MPSSAVRDIDYNPDTRILSVTFVPTGKRYAYREVPFETYDAFISAFSKGTFFNRFIRDQFDFELVET